MAKVNLTYSKVRVNAQKYDEGGDSFPNFGRRLTGEQENNVNFAGTAASRGFNRA
jgi:hypothetical protein